MTLIDGDLYVLSYARCQQENRLEPDVSSFADSYMYDQSQSFQAGVSKSNMSSFSVYEDSVEQLSFVPFHDSWVNSSRDTRHSVMGDHSALGPGKDRPVSAALKHQLEKKAAPVQQPLEKEGRVVYHAPLGVPLEGDGMGDGNASALDHSFTQVGICHPKVAPNISTPVGKKIGN